jgi:hypothetical protein
LEGRRRSSELRRAAAARSPVQLLGPSVAPWVRRPLRDPVILLLELELGVLASHTSACIKCLNPGSNNIAIRLLEYQLSCSSVLLLLGQNHHDTRPQFPQFSYLNFPNIVSSIIQSISQDGGVGDPIPSSLSIFMYCT